MTQEEIEEFKRKARAYYGTEQLGAPGSQEYEPWRDIVRDYKEKATDRYGPHGDYPGMTVNPDAFSYRNPLGLLSSTEDMDEVLGNVNYRAKLDQLAPDRLQGPIKPPMEMRTDGTGGAEYSQMPEGGIGHRGLVSATGLSPWHGYSMLGGEVTPAQQMAMNEQMVPGFQQYFGGGHQDELSLSQAPEHYGYDQFTKQPPGLLESGGPLAETSPGEGGKWESDPRWQQALGRYMMQFGNNFSQTDPFYLD